MFVDRILLAALKSLSDFRLCWVNFNSVSNIGVKNQTYTTSFASVLLTPNNSFAVWVLSGCIH